MKDKMKTHNLLKVVFIAIVVALLLTWILPTTSLSQAGEAVQGAISPQGPFNGAFSIVLALQNFLPIVIYVLAVGGLYGVLYEIKAYRKLLDSIVKKFEGKETLFLVLSMVILTLLSSMAGLSVLSFFLFPLIISLVLMMGYDKITAALVTAGSVIVGLIGTVFSANNVVAITRYFAIEANENVWIKLIILVLAFGLLVYNTLSRAKKNRNTKELVKGSYIPKEVNTKEKTLPMIILIDLALIVLILGFFSWQIFDVTFFSELLTKLNGVKLFGYPIFIAIFGVTEAFGTWSYEEATAVVLLTSWLLSFAYKIKFSSYLSSLVDGAKRALKPAVIVGLVYAVLFITTYTETPILLTIVKPILDLTKTLNIFTMSVVAFISSIFSVEMAPGFYVAVPYFAETVVTNLSENGIRLLSIIWQSIYGVAMLIAPTGVVLMGTLAYLHIPYGKWLKAVLNLFLELLVVLLIVFTIVAVL